jgi:hypothetical protein
MTATALIGQTPHISNDIVSYETTPCRGLKGSEKNDKMRMRGEGWPVRFGPALERVLKIARAVLRRGGAAGVVAPQSKIHEGYSPSSLLAIHPAALAIPFPVYFQNTLFAH